MSRQRMTLGETGRPFGDDDPATDGGSWPHKQAVATIVRAVRGGARVVAVTTSSEYDRASLVPLVAEALAAERTVGIASPDIRSGPAQKIASAFDESAEVMLHMQARARLSDAITRAAKAGHPCLLIADEAHAFTDMEASVLAAALNEAGDDVTFGAVLLGAASLEERLASSALRTIGRAAIDLGPLTLEDTGRHLRSWVHGPNEGPWTFDDEAVAVLHEVSGGTIPALDALAQACLERAREEGEQQIDGEAADAVVRVALTERVEDASPARPTPPGTSEPAEAPPAIALQEPETEDDPDTPAWSADGTDAFAAQFQEEAGGESAPDAAGPDEAPSDRRHPEAGGDEVADVTDEPSPGVEPPPDGTDGSARTVGEPRDAEAEASAAAREGSESDTARSEPMEAGSSAPAAVADALGEQPVADGVPAADEGAAPSDPIAHAPSSRDGAASAPGEAIPPPADPSMSGEEADASPEGTTSADEEPAAGQEERIRSERPTDAVTDEQDASSARAEDGHPAQDQGPAAGATATGDHAGPEGTAGADGSEPADDVQRGSSGANGLAPPEQSTDAEAPDVRSGPATRQPSVATKRSEGDRRLPDDEDEDATAAGPFGRLGTGDDPGSGGDASDAPAETERPASAARAPVSPFTDSSAKPLLGEGAEPATDGERSRVAPSARTTGGATPPPSARSDGADVDDGSASPPQPTSAADGATASLAGRAPEKVSLDGEDDAWTRAMAQAEQAAAAGSPIRSGEAGAFQGHALAADDEPGEGSEGPEPDPTLLTDAAAGSAARSNRAAWVAAGVVLCIAAGVLVAWQAPQLGLTAGGVPEDRAAEAPQAIVDPPAPERYAVLDGETGAEAGDVRTLHAAGLDFAASSQPTEAKIAYTRAALRGHDRSAYYLAQMFEAGFEVNPNPEVARAWYDRAGRDAAAARLEEVSAAGAPTDVADPLFSRRLPDGTAEFVWSSVPGASDYRVEFAADRSATDAAGYVETPLTGVIVDVPEDLAFWRVRTGPEGQAPEWTPIDPPEDVSSP